MAYQMTPVQEWWSGIFGLSQNDIEEIRTNAGERECAVCKKWVPKGDLVEDDHWPSPRHATVEECLTARERPIR